MKRLLLLALCALASVAQAEVWTARYGVAETFNFKLYNADGTLDVDEADGGTEVSLSCNEGAETTATNDFVDEGTFYSIALTAGEMQCERIAVVIAATTTEVFFIQTTNHASAMTPDFTQSGDAFAASGVNITTIATLASQTEFTLTAGSADNDGYNNWGLLVIDASTNAQRALGVVCDYVGSTKTVTLCEDPGIFTMAASDTAVLIPAKLDDSTITAISTNVGEIKAKTDQLEFTLTGEVDANIQSVNDASVCGAGAGGDPWGPCP